MSKSVWQDKSFTSGLSLAHYDPKVKIAVASDASEYNVGVVLLHKYDGSKMKAFTHASCLLLQAEKNYSQIEKKL